MRYVIRQNVKMSLNIESNKYSDFNYIDKLKLGR